MDEEELQKRNTDCVYFLASPLTCKKGIECEYRHSEMARLNPRDCWYWLAGSCLNPSCAFRHPPFEAQKELSFESAIPDNWNSAPVNKVNVPCYFYFSGFCSKGDRCSFLHGPDNGTPAGKTSKTLSGVGEAPILENMTSKGSSTGPVPIVPHPNPPQALPEIAVQAEIRPKENVDTSTLGIVKDQSSSPDISSSECEEAAGVESDAFLLGRGLIQRRSVVCTDTNSEEQFEGHIEREDWLESSPGFDVLVDDRLENLVYENDPDQYLLANGRDGQDFDGHFLGHEYKDSEAYDPAYPDAGILYKQESLDSYDQFDHEHVFEYPRKAPGHSRERILNPILPRKRKFRPVDLAVDGRRTVDLRDHLRRWRFSGDHRATHSSRRNKISSRIDQNREGGNLHGTQQLHGRLTRKGSSYGLGAPARNGTVLNVTKAQGRFRQSQNRSSRPYYKENRQSKKQFHSSEVLSKRSSGGSVMFSGPKTLAQIKEEKRLAKGDVDSSGKLGHPNQKMSEEFQSPKPLSEILEDKKKLHAVVDVNSNCS
ncbi:zinc finger CCCH domain-containing protein 34-like [Diospyros lotus]|uniref:zinc finger CCCH domain-containing protein 34-like n=1 Tax=Diospyros lotus TaxID=55363 RepID=UPI002257918E|nr:zinc finger CCCH domain-containing protein 34-like [Diospyros lotus]